MLEAEVVRAVREPPVGLAPPLAAGDEPPRAGGDVAREVRLAHHSGEAKVRGVLLLELLGRREDVGRPEVAADRGSDRRLAEPDRRLEDDELLPRRQRGLDPLHDVFLERPQLAVGERLRQGGSHGRRPLLRCDDGCPALLAGRRLAAHPPYGGELQASAAVGAELHFLRRPSIRAFRI